MGSPCVLGPFSSPKKGPGNEAKNGVDRTGRKQQQKWHTMWNVALNALLDQTAGLMAVKTLVISTNELSYCTIIMQVRILVTHGIGFLPQCDVIVVMADGQIREVGSYTDLIEDNRAFAQFLQMYKGVDEKEEDPGNY